MARFCFSYLSEQTLQNKGLCIFTTINSSYLIKLQMSPMTFLPLPLHNYCCNCKNHYNHFHPELQECLSKTRAIPCVINLELHQRYMCHTNNQVWQWYRSLQSSTVCVQDDYRHAMWCEYTRPYLSLQTGYMSHNARGENNQWRDGGWFLLLMMAGKSPLPPDTLSQPPFPPPFAALYNWDALINVPAHTYTHTATTVHTEDWLICYRLLMHIAA